MVRVPPGPAYQVVATPVGGGHDFASISHSGWRAPGSEADPPLSMRIRTRGVCFSNSARAVATLGAFWKRRGASPLGAAAASRLYRTGDNVVIRADCDAWGTSSATKMSRNSVHREMLPGPSESTWVPFTMVTHTSGSLDRAETMAGHCPPVCSSWKAPERNTGTVVLAAQVAGARWS